jgi:NitT/TauT family transport system substrate-binding protein
MSNIKRYVIACISVLSFLVPVSGICQSELQPVRLMVQWLPQAQFAGYIVALEKGFYREEGLALELRFSDGNDSPLTEMMEKRVDFCTAWLSQTLKLFNDGVKLCNICQLFQKSNLMLITKRQSNILTPADMDGRRVSIWGGDFSIQPFAFFRKNDIEPQIISQGYNVDAFLADACDVTSAMYYNEYHKIILAGVDDQDLVKFFFADYGLNFPEDGIYCLTQTLEQSPQITQKFIRATLKGWQYAFDNKAEALQYVLKFARNYHIRTNWAQQNWMLQAIQETITFQVGNDPARWGELNAEDYYRTAEELQLQGLITTIPDISQFYQRVQP